MVIRRLLIAATLIALSACSGVSSSEDSTSAPAVTPAESAAPTAEPESAEAEPESAPNSDEASGSIVVTERQRMFIENGTTWLYTITAVVESNLDPLEHRDGRCISVLGTITPTALETGFAANLVRSPEIQIEVNGGRWRRTLFGCKATSELAAGYSPLDETWTMRGNPSAFYVQFYLGPEVANVDVLTIAAGTPDEESLNTFTIDLATTIPAPDTSPLSEREDLPLQPLSDAIGVWADKGTSWDIKTIAVAEIASHADYVGTSSCIAIHGLAVPSIEARLITKDSFPPLYLMADGKVSPSGILECDVSALEGAGFGPGLRAQVMDGTPYPFFTLSLVPQGQPIDALVIGRASSDDAEYFAIELQESLRFPDIDGFAREPLDTIPLGQNVTLGEALVSILGVAEVANIAPENWPGRCYAIFAVVTAPEGVTLRGLGIGAIVDGRFNEARIMGACDANDPDAAGYARLGLLDVHVSDGNQFAFYTNALLPADATIEAIVVGHPSAEATAFSSEITKIAPAN